MSYGGFEYGGSTDGGFGSGGFMGGDNFGSGGFMSGNDGGGSSFGGGAPAEKPKARERERQTLIPLTIKKVLSAAQAQTDDVFSVDGTELHNICIVGCVMEKNEASTNVVYELEDGTGRVSCKSWLDAEETHAQTAQRSQITQGTYVKVFGQLRDFGGKKTLNAFNVRKIEGIDELTAHMLEVIYVRVKSKQAKEQPKQASFGAQGGGMSFAPMGGGGQSLSNDGGGYDNGMGFTPVQSAVVEAFTNDGGANEGRSIASVVGALQSKGITEDQVRQSVDFLSREGHLYSTIDEEHFKSTSGF